MRRAVAAGGLLLALGCVGWLKIRVGAIQPTPGGWKTSELRDLGRAAYAFVQQRDAARARDACTRGLERAKAAGDRSAQVFFLNYLGSLDFQAFRFRAAADSYRRAIDLAGGEDRLDQLPSLYLNLSSVYLQLQDVERAAAAAEAGVAAARRVPEFKSEAELQLQRAAVRSRQGDWEAARAALAAGIEAARRRQDLATEALAWSRLGDESLDHGEIAAGERALAESFRLRKLHRLPDLAQTYGRLGKLKLAQGDLTAALRFTVLAKGSPMLPGRTLFPYQIENQLGRILEARGDRGAALEAYRRAVEAGRSWRLEVPVADDVLARANSELYRQILGSFVELGARLALERGDTRLSREVLLAVEEERAFSFNAGLAARRPLPEVYWEQLAELRGLEARLLYKRTTEALERAGQLRWQLSEIEAAANFGVERKDLENFLPQNSLRHFLGGITEQEVWFSLYSGTTSTYMWAATKEGLSLKQLPGRDALRSRISLFRQAVGENRPERVALGRQFYSDLADESTGAARKKYWMISPDEVLADLPFAALVTGEGKDGPRYLAARHSLELKAPGWRKAVTGGAPVLLAAGDPVYNLADPRFGQRPAAGSGWFRVAASEPGWPQLHRLAGTLQEVEGAAAAWRRSGGQATVLAGRDVSAEALLTALSAKPRAIHLAMHVVPGSRPGEALLALGWNREGEFTVWTQQDIAALPVAGATVVLSGCHSAAGERLAGSDVLGLSRAWLRAGAAAVVTTVWAVEDHPGRIWESFYGHLFELEGQYGPGARAAAVALQRAQRDMGRERDGADPRQWAGIQVLGRN